MVQAPEEMHESGLAGARRAHDGHELTLVDCQAHSPECLHLGGPFAVDLGHVLHLDERLPVDRAFHCGLCLGAFPFEPFPCPPLRAPFPPAELLPPPWPLPPVWLPPPAWPLPPTADPFLVPAPPAPPRRCATMIRSPSITPSL